MKNKLACFSVLFVVLSLLLSGCSSEDPYMKGMPKYESAEKCFNAGLENYFNYCKYFYTEESVKSFKTHKKFKEVTAESIESVLDYFYDFAYWQIGGPYENSYDFDVSVVKEGDYFYIVDNTGVTVGNGLLGEYNEFESYNVYYVDMESCILYFIHSNILGFEV